MGITTTKNKGVLKMLQDFVVSLDFFIHNDCLKNFHTTKRKVSREDNKIKF